MYICIMLCFIFLVLTWNQIQLLFCKDIIRCETIGIYYILYTVIVTQLAKGFPTWTVKFNQKVMQSNPLSKGFFSSLEIRIKLENFDGKRVFIAYIL